MRRGRYGALAALTGLLALGSGCGGSSGGDDAASCAGIVVRAGATYLPRDIDHPITRTGPVLRARMPACDDTPNDDARVVPASVVRVRAIEGVRLRDAFWVVDAPVGRPGHHLAYVRDALLRERDAAPTAVRRLLD